MTGGSRRFGDQRGSVRLDRVLVAALCLADLVAIVVDRRSGALCCTDRASLLGITALASAAVFLWRRPAPLLVLTGVAFFFLVAATIDERVLLTQRSTLQLLVVMYAIGSWCTRRRLASIVPPVLALAMAAAIAADGQGMLAVASVPVAVVLAPWFAGTSARLRRMHLDDVEQRLHRAEADREERARAAVTEERNRIAREMHDVVAHHVSLIGLQAGAARTNLGVDQNRTSAALSAIEDSSRRAVQEMRHLLDALRLSNGDHVQVPQPGPTDLARLCEDFAAVGLDVHLTVSGPCDSLNPSVGLAVYRIAEEALTNVTRHSTATNCAALLIITGDAVRLTVTDPGPTRSHAPVSDVGWRSPGTSRGLMGIRERVEVLGGSANMAPVGRGFVVDVTIPVETT